MPAALVDVPTVTPQVLAGYQYLLDDGETALSSTDVSKIQAVGQQIVDFQNRYRDSFDADPATYGGSMDQLDALKSSLSDRYVALAPPLAGSLAARPDYVPTPDYGGTAPKDTVLGGTIANLQDEVQRGGTAVKEAVVGIYKTVTGDALGAVDTIWDKIKWVVYILAIGIGLALIVAAYVYFGAAPHA
jgi:hypothetical protein